MGPSWKFLMGQCLALMIGPCLAGGAPADSLAAVAAPPAKPLADGPEGQDAAQARRDQAASDASKAAAGAQAEKAVAAAKAREAAAALEAKKARVQARRGELEEAEAEMSRAEADLRRAEARLRQADGEPDPDLLTVDGKVSLARAAFLRARAAAMRPEGEGPDPRDAAGREALRAAKFESDVAESRRLAYLIGRYPDRPDPGRRVDDDADPEALTLDGEVDLARAAVFHAWDRMLWGERTDPIWFKRKSGYLSDRLNHEQAKFDLEQAEMRRDAWRKSRSPGLKPAAPKAP